jgi:tyrosyl-tRNA synthetase
LIWEEILLKKGSFKLLEERGFVGQVTDPGLAKVLDKEPITLYAGFDPTARSLHVGNLLVIMCLAQFQRHGHRPIAVVGGGTGMIGDPSGKTTERPLLTEDEIEENLKGIRAQLERFLDFDSENPAMLVNNAEWLKRFGFIEFLRDAGKFFRLREMLARESVKMRLASDEGMSFTEFCYQVLQAYDFLYLFDKFNCILQVGGSDQWGNITAGMDLIRRIRGKPAYGLVSPLITTSTGTKFGKTEAGAVWLDAEWTSPYRFYQYWMQTDDRDVIRYLNYFTFLEKQEIEELKKEVEENPEKRSAQNRLAFEVTLLVHGPEAACKADQASQVLFGQEIQNLTDKDLEMIFQDVPSSNFRKSRLEDGLALVDALVETNLSKSKSEARRLIQGGGAYVNNVRVNDTNAKLGTKSLASEHIMVLRTGKKTYHLLRFE